MFKPRMVYSAEFDEFYDLDEKSKRERQGQDSFAAHGAVGHGPGGGSRFGKPTGSGRGRRGRNGADKRLEAVVSLVGALFAAWYAVFVMFPKLAGAGKPAPPKFSDEQLLKIAASGLAVAASAEGDSCRHVEGSDKAAKNYALLVRSAQFACDSRNVTFVAAVGPDGNLSVSGAVFEWVESLSAPVGGGVLITGKSFDVGSKSVFRLRPDKAGQLVIERK